MTVHYFVLILNFNFELSGSLDYIFAHSRTPDKIMIMRNVNKYLIYITSLNRNEGHIKTKK